VWAVIAKFTTPEPDAGIGLDVNELASEEAVAASQLTPGPKVPRTWRAASMIPTRHRVLTTAVARGVGVLVL